MDRKAIAIAGPTPLLLPATPMYRLANQAMRDWRTHPARRTLSFFRQKSGGGNDALMSKDHSLVPPSQTQFAAPRINWHLPIL